MIWQTFLLTCCILFASGCPSSPEDPSTTKAPTTDKKPDDAAGDPSNEESTEKPDPEDNNENTQGSSEGDDPGNEEESTEVQQSVNSSGSFFISFKVIELYFFQTNSISHYHSLPIYTY